MKGFAQFDLEDILIANYGDMCFHSNANSITDIYKILPDNNPQIDTNNSVFEEMLSDLIYEQQYPDLRNF